MAKHKIYKQRRPKPLSDDPRKSRTVLIGVKQTAKILGKSRSMVQRLCRQKRLVAQKLDPDEPNSPWVIRKNSATHFRPKPVGRPRVRPEREPSFLDYIREQIK